MKENVNWSLGMSVIGTCKEFYQHHIKPRLEIVYGWFTGRKVKKSAGGDNGVELLRLDRKKTGIHDNPRKRRVKKPSPSMNPPSIGHPSYSRKPAMKSSDSADTTNKRNTLFSKDSLKNKRAVERPVKLSDDKVRELRVSSCIELEKWYPGGEGFERELAKIPGAGKLKVGDYDSIKKDFEAEVDNCFRNYGKLLTEDELAVTFRQSCVPYIRPPGADLAIGFERAKLYLNSDNGWNDCETPYT
ncbi:MAG: hypothetical protein ACR2PT_07785 [Endozoicomonas sp.]